MKLLANRLRNTDVALADSVFLDVTGRTAKRLLEMAGESDEFVLPITQEELAGMVGASRERVNKAIASFIRLGWLEQHDRRYRHHEPRGARAAGLADRPERRPCQELDHPAPGVGRVVGAVGGAARVVDEAVVGALVAHDGGTARSSSVSRSATGTYGSRVPQRCRIGARCRRAAEHVERLGHVGDRQASGSRIIP